MMKTTEIDIIYTNKVSKVFALKRMVDLVQTPTFAENMFSWDGVCLDSTYNALETLLLINTITGNSTNNLVTKKWVENILMSFYDDKSGGFRQQIDGSFPSVYSVDDACRIAFGFIDELPNGFKRKQRNIIKFIFSCRDESTGAFKDSPELMPTLSSTFGALLALRLLAKSLDYDVSSFTFPDKLVRYLRDCTRDNGSILGFANDSSPESERFVCSSYYALKIAESIGKLEDVVNKDDVKKLLKYLKSCWVEDKGGFSWNPSNTPTILHTRYALFLFLLLIENGLLTLKEATKEFKLAELMTKVTQFVQKCKSGNVYSIAENESPTPHATRYALDILTICLEAKKKWNVPFQICESEIKAIIPHASHIERFLDSCKDSLTNCYTGMPFYFKANKDHLQQGIDNVIDSLIRKPPRIQKTKLVEGKLGEGHFSNLFLGDYCLLHVESYPTFYSSCWQSRVTAKKFLKLLSEIKIPDRTPCIMYTRSRPENAEYTFSKVKNVKDLNNECLFLRVNYNQFNVTWHVEESLKTNIIGFISENKNLTRFQHLFGVTSISPLPRERASFLRDITSHY